MAGRWHIFVDFDLLGIANESAAALVVATVQSHDILYKTSQDILYTPERAFDSCRLEHVSRSPAFTRNVKGWATSQ